MVVDNDTVTVEVNGKEFRWWEGVTIDLELTNITREFAVSFTQDFSRETPSAFDGLPRVGDEVKLWVGEDLLCTGYITKSQSSYSSSSVTLSINGASKTIDLVECTLPIGAKHRVSSVSLKDGVEMLVKNYGIKVVDEVKSSKKVSLDVSPTKKIKSALEELIQGQSIILTDNGNGDLVMTTAGKGGLAHDALKLGRNVLEGSRSVDGKSLYSQYVVVGQSTNGNSDKAVTANQTKASASIDGVRKRECVYQQSGDANMGAMLQRATLLKNHAIGASETYEYTAQGWRQSNGDLWSPNTTVQVYDDIFRTSQVFLIDRVTLTKDNSGTKSKLHLIHPEALLNTDVPDLPKKASTSSNASYQFTHKGETGEAQWTK